MYAIEFNTKINNGKIEIPQKYLNELKKNVRVIILNDTELEEQETTPNRITAKGIFNEYANTDMVGKEKEAWGEAVREKHGHS